VKVLRSSLYNNHTLHEALEQRMGALEGVGKPSCKDSLLLYSSSFALLISACV